ncbi:hypothetical protein [Pseudonocardia sp.]|uniref:hypothetical protein n=1 Tax=Pseudonocardia sp. TaxID=60912 RepID=UPI0031FDF1A9
MLEDIARAVDTGVRSALVADLGVLEIATSPRPAGEFPADLQSRSACQMGLSNPPRSGSRSGWVPTHTTSPPT